MQAVPNLDTSSMVTLLASLVVVLMVAISYLFKINSDLTKEHKSDLKLFDDENKKINKDTLDVLNKYFLNIESTKINDEELRRKVDQVITLLEKCKTR